MVSQLGVLVGILVGTLMVGVYTSGVLGYRWVWGLAGVGGWGEV